ncbi:interferon-induced very large GTPase 1-like [Garra rufa]|uniref:interferon-induced very large GTPase 1-like n=1 Tax=Garra rufa TaxID=137080 RepID=UPI003CCEC1F0
MTGVRMDFVAGEEGSNSKPYGHADMSKSNKPLDPDLPINSMEPRFPNLTIALFGNSAYIQLGHENILLGEKLNVENADTSRIIPLQRNISEHSVSVINMTGLNKAENMDHVIDQLIIENEIHVFIFVVRLDQLTDADIMDLELLQRKFGDTVLQFVMLLFTYESEEECDTIIDDLKKNPVLEQLLGKCGERYQTCNKLMNNQSEMRELMNKIERLFKENQQQCYTREVFNKALQSEDLTNSECKSDGPSVNEETKEPTTTTETREMHRENEEEIKTERERPDQPKEKEISSGSKTLIDRLHLESSHHKLRAADVLQLTAHSLQFHESCAEEELILAFIQKLLMMNYRARYIKTKETSQQQHIQRTNNDSYENECDIFDEMSLSNDGTSQPNQIHPMDVQMAMFYCADSFLKQLMVTKLSQCQYALPLLVPDPFTRQIEFPLWTFRQINKSWKIRNTNNEIISQTQPIYKAETPMVSFFRFDSVSSSKSQLMNSLINEKHNTFFHRNCPGSSRTRVLMDGVVEIAWFCPSGSNDDKFSDCVAFCNLHGDAGDHEKQLQILTEIASVNVVLLPQLQKNVRGMKQVQKLYKDSKSFIFLFAEDVSSLVETRRGKYKIGLKDRNLSDVADELRKAINNCLSEPFSTFILEDVSKYSDIRVDEEDDDDCRRGREAAQQMMSLLEKKDLTEIKESFLPHQGKLWHQWSQKNKELHRPQGDETELDISRKHTEMKKIRQQQHESKISEFMKHFIKEMNSDAANKMFFLKWITILLDEYTMADLSALHHKYNEKWSKVKNQGKSEQLKAEQKVQRMSEELQDAVFGLEHIMREIGQIYESCSSVKKNKKDLQVDSSSLPSFAAEMMISGFPLELMDGDADHVPVIWISAVLDQLIQKLGDQRVFVLSVLGLQSSGKSTMLNAMFGLQFAVSAGRCTRGAFMQLVKVSDEMKTQMNFDYILVVDTEGLRALELAGRSTGHHDNELATFVVGLANLTLINIFGENPSEMQDILQIVVQAFMRMKKVRLNPSCVFVHQNVSDITAEEKNMEGRRRLQQILDEMTKLAAEEEDYDSESFSDVITFDVQKDVKYFAQLWEGSPPMAPPNPKYCENIQELKEYIISHASDSHGMMLKDFKVRIKDLWEALLNERFIFSFRNSLEISVYRKLETKYNNWCWRLRSAMMETENKLYNKIVNEAIHEVEETYLHKELKQTSEEVKKSMSELFENDTCADILIQWKTSFENKIKDVLENIVRETKRKLNGILQQQDLRKKIDAQRKHYENTLYEESRKHALQLKDNANEEETLKKTFDLFWEQQMKKISTDTHPIKGVDILRDVTTILSNGCVPVDHMRDIFTVLSYTDFVQLKWSQGIMGGLKSAFRSFKITFGGGLLSNEDEAQIRTFVTDVAQQSYKMIQSFNISTMGYNISYIQQLIDYIKMRVIEHQEGSVKYVFKKEFFTDLIFSICKEANKMITDQHRLFRDINDPIKYVKKREEYYSIFQKYCHGATSAAIFGEIICQKLKEPIEQSVCKMTARDVADEMRSNCETLNGNKSNLEKHILKTLAEEEDFDKYMDYIQNPRDHFKSFIRDEVSRYITDKFSVSVLPKMEENIKVLQQKIMKAAHESTEHVQEKKCRDVNLWLNSFTLQLSDGLIFSENDLSEVKHDDIDDFSLLEDAIRKNLPAIMSNISKHFNDFLWKLDFKDRPDELLIDHFCQCCWVQCPFCGATCTNTIENHSGDHSVPFHRINGLNGFYYDETSYFCTEFCSTLVTSCESFQSAKGWFSFKNYRSAGTVYANWSIIPDLSEQPYWKWFVCKFQRNIENHYNKSFQGNGSIPKCWRLCTKEDAIASLDESYTFKEESEFFQQGRGVRQGCSLSPTLFNIYINELAEALDRSDQIPGLTLHDSEIKCLLYADDLVLLSPTAEGLQRSLALLEQYCEEWALTVNLDKTRVMVFQKKARSQGNRYQFYYGGEVLEHSTSYTYLGIEISASGSFSLAVKALHNITDYKPLPQASDDDASLPDALNQFYSRFEMQNDTPAEKLHTPSNDQVLCLSPADVRKTLSRINPRKAAGPDNIPGHVLRDCAAQLTDVLTDIFNISLSQPVVPTCLKSTSIIPVPKKSHVSCLNDCRPIALTPIMMKCFERLVLHHIKTSLPNTLGPLQFAYHPNRSTDDAISSTLHLALTHLEQIDSYLIHKLNVLGLNTSLCNWILDFLTGRPQSVRVGHNTSSTTTLSTGAPQGCVLSPLLFTLLTHYCTAKFSSNHIIKFADDTTVVGLIRNNDETHYREEVAQLAKWCGANNLSLNVGKTKEVVMDFRRNSVDHPPMTIDGSTVDRVGSTKFLGVHITEDLSWTTNVTSLNKKGQQRLYFLRRLKRASLPTPILTTLYRSTIESVLTTCITVCYGNCSAADRKTLQRTVNTAAKIIGASLPSILDIFHARCSSKASSIVKDPTHPSHNLFQLLPSGRRYRSIKAHSVRLLNSFFPQAAQMAEVWKHQIPLFAQQFLRVSYEKPVVEIVEDTQTCQPKRGQGGFRNLVAPGPPSGAGALMSSSPKEPGGGSRWRHGVPALLLGQNHPGVVVLAPQLDTLEVQPRRAGQPVRRHGTHTRRHKCTATARSTWGNATHPLAAPPSRMVMEEELERG